MVLPLCPRLLTQASGNLGGGQRAGHVGRGALLPMSGRTLPHVLYLAHDRESMVTWNGICTRVAGPANGWSKLVLIGCARQSLEV